MSISSPQAATRAARLPLPAGVKPYRLAKSHTAILIVYHLVALLALLPWFFSWTGVVLVIVGHYVFAMLGINIGYHRLLTHRGFECPKWFEHVLAVLGVCNVQDSPVRWVAAHRMHHQHADDEGDPHSPLVSFLWAHMAWLVVRNGEIFRQPMSEKFAKDLLRDPFYVALDHYQYFVILASWVIFFAGGFFAELLLGGTVASALQFGSSLLIWGVFVRTIVVWHVTWSVNSLTHMWGYRTYETNDDSRNNILIGLLGSGEGWHNNHHADQRSAKHGHAWWELDMTYGTIRLFEKLGLVSGIVMPNSRVLDVRVTDRPQG